MAGKPIEEMIRENIDYFVTNVMTTANGYNFDMDDFSPIKKSAAEEKNEDQGDIERFEGLGIPENRRVMKAGLYRNALVFTIHVDLPVANQNTEDAAKVADDWKKVFGLYPQLNPSGAPNSSPGAFEAQYQKYVKIFSTDPDAPTAIDFFVQIRYRQRRTAPETAG